MRDTVSSCPILDQYNYIF